MTVWHEKRGADLMLRLGGAALLGCAWLLGRWLWSLVRARPPHDMTAPEFLVGMVMFCCASLGAAMVTLGRHLFDQVRISERWATRMVAIPEKEKPVESVRAGLSP